MEKVVLFKLHHAILDAAMPDPVGNRAEVEKLLAKRQEAQQALIRDYYVLGRIKDEPFQTALAAIDDEIANLESQLRAIDAQTPTIGPKIKGMR